MGWLLFRVPRLPFRIRKILMQTLLKRAVNSSVGNYLIGGERILRSTIHARDCAPRLANEHEAAGHVPGMIVECPVTVKSPTGHVGQVQRRRTGPPQ